MKIPISFEKASLVLLVGGLHSVRVCNAFDCFPDSATLKAATLAIPTTSDGVGYTYPGYGPIEDWCFESEVTSMSGLFTDKEAFNADISGWDVSRITNMAGMFYEASTFNQLLNGWDVSSVTEMKETFLLARAFNRPLNAWDVSSVTDMQRTFFIASSFNTPLDNWNVSSVMNMIETFREASSFNQNLCAWGEKMNAAPRTEPVFFMFRDSGCESELDPLYASTPYENLCTSVCNTRCSPSWYNDCDDQLSLLHSALRGEGKTKDTNLSLK